MSQIARCRNKLVHNFPDNNSFAYPSRKEQIQLYNYFRTRSLLSRHEPQHTLGTCQFLSAYQHLCLHIRMDARVRAREHQSLPCFVLLYDWNAVVERHTIPFRSLRKNRRTQRQTMKSFVPGLIICLVNATISRCIVFTHNNGINTSSPAVVCPAGNRQFTEYDDNETGLPSVQVLSLIHI